MSARVITEKDLEEAKREGHDAGYDEGFNDGFDAGDDVNSWRTAVIKFSTGAIDAYWLVKDCVLAHTDINRKIVAITIHEPVDVVIPLEKLPCPPA